MSRVTIPVCPKCGSMDVWVGDDGQIWCLTCGCVGKPIISQMDIYATSDTAENSEIEVYEG